MRLTYSPPPDYCTPRACYRKAPVRRETNDERLARRYGNGIILVGDYDGMHEGPPTAFYTHITGPTTKGHDSLSPKGYRRYLKKRNKQNKGRR